MIDMEALVIGGDHQNTLGVVEALGQKGVHVHLIIIATTNKCFVAKSRYVIKKTSLSKSQEIIDYINSEYENCSDIIPVIACSDDAASLLSVNSSQLPKCLAIPDTSIGGNILEWSDKEKMTQTAIQVGMSVPKSWLVRDTKIPPDITFPCVTKPYTSVNHGKSGFAKCESSSELNSYFKALESNEPVQVQQYIDKDFEFQLLGCSINGGETVIIPGRTHINTTTGFNNLVFLKYDVYEDIYDNVVKLAKKFVATTGYSGLFSIEFMHGKDGKDYFLEMNFRNDGNGICVTHSGTNLPYIWYLACKKENYTIEINSSTVSTTYMMPEISFFLSMLSGEVSFKEWRNDWKLTNCYLTYFKEDKSPFYMMLRKNMKGIISCIAVVTLKKLHLYNIIKRIK